MAAPKDFVTGFNHNVRHKGHGYHVQTEDSGAEIAHVITHLFQGGNILASKKTSYADLRGTPDLKAQVRLLMEEQHRQMLRQLVNGAFDETAAANVAVRPEQLAQDLAASDAPAEPHAAKKRPAPIEVVRFPPPGAASEEDPFDADIDIETAIGFLPSVETPGDRGRVAAPPPSEATQGQPPAAWPAAAPPSQQVSGGPQPGAPLWPTAVEAAQLQLGGVQPAAAQQPPAPIASAPPPPPAKAVDRTPGPSTWRPDPQPDTVFGEDGGGVERSLDQVILRYLAGERDD